MTVRRALLYFIKLAILVAVAVWLADRPGRVALEWLGYRVETSVALLLVAVLFIGVLVAFLFEAWRLIWRAPRRLARARAERRRHKGYRALTQGMVAVAAGEVDEARRQARRAHQYLKEPPLTLLLAAQAAQLEGDETAARRYFTAMLERPATRFLGLRGLLTQALRAGDDAEALRLAEQARAERPSTGWALTTLLDLQLRGGDWRAAEATLAQASKHRAVTPAAAKRMQAVLLTERARLALKAQSGAQPAVPAGEQANSEAAAEAGRDAPALPAPGLTLREAVGLARQAVALAPDLVPARAILAVLLAKIGKRRRAAKAVEAGWAQTPHPNLAAAYAMIEPAENPVARVRRFEHLAALNPANRESHLALAEAALAAQLWGQARTHLAKAMDLDGGTAPSARVCRLMARLEEGERGDAEAARRWLVAAAEAESDPAWICEKCGRPAAEWQARCPHCGAFDSLAWRAAPRPATLVLEAPAEPSAGHPGTPAAGRTAEGGRAGEGGATPQGRALAPVGGGLGPRGDSRNEGGASGGLSGFPAAASGPPVDAARLVN